MAAARQNYDLEDGATTPDGKISLLTARCLGSCSLAPALVYDGEVAGRVQAEQMIQRFEEWKK
jgi:bidirectional [NiFe] hydrogenase diaphorase subunit